MSGPFLCAEVVWKIENFSMLPEKEELVLRTPTFKVNSLLGTSWYFSVRKYKMNNKCKLSLNCKEEYFAGCIKVYYNCLIGDFEAISSYLERIFFSEKYEAIFLFREVMYGKTEYLLKNTFTFRFKIWHTDRKPTEKSQFVFQTVLPDEENICISKIAEMSSTSTQTSGDHSANTRCKCTADKPKNSAEEFNSKNEKKLYGLHFDIQNMYRSGRLSDFTLRVQDQDFPVHSFILSARSPVFDRMMETNMTEKKENILVLEDLDADTVSQMVDYIYLDNPGEVCSDEALQLYYAADKYDIRGLKEKASCVLMKNINPKNVLEILELADKHNDAELKSASVKIILNHELEVMTSDEMKILLKTNPQLVAETSVEMARLKTK